MKKFFYFIIALLFIIRVNAQIMTVGAGGITIKSGTIFYAEKLTLTPSADFTLAGVSLSKNTSVTNSTLNPYISRIYLFSATTAPFSGRVQINYVDPGELNGIAEANLQLNVHNGSLWQAFPGTVNTTNDYVLSNPLTVALRELTLGSALTPLPLSWLSFTADKQKSGMLLQWRTGNEQNTKDFVVQHNMDGAHWNDLTTIIRSVANSNTHDYNYVHNSSVKGSNFYRILQNDLDGKKSYSEIRIVKFNGHDETFTVLVNLVSNDMIQVQVNSATTLSLYTAGGKLLWIKQTKAGLQNIDVSTYAKGIYLLKGNDAIIKIVIQ